MESKLVMTKSPYLVEPFKNAQEVIKIAVDNGLLQKFELDEELIKDYLDSKDSIPLWIVEAACDINKAHIKIPAQYQYLWFCLHGANVTRTQPSGRKFRSLINFTSCYVNSDDRLKELIIKTCKYLNIPQTKLSILCGYKEGTIRMNMNKIPLIVLLKISQILKRDIWKLLEGYMLYGKTSKKGRIKIPNCEKDVKMGIILTWLRTEGHLELRSTHVEINQKNNIKSLKGLRRLINQTFNLTNTPTHFFKGSRGEDRLIISSSPLRQLLCLKFDLPLGYKSGCLKKMDFEGFSEEDYKKVMSAFVQTEGCLSSHNTRNKKKKLPRFEFIVKDNSLAEDCVFVLKKLNFQPSFKHQRDNFKVGIYNSKEVIRLVNHIKPYILNQNKINYLKKICSNGIGL